MGGLVACMMKSATATKAVGCIILAARSSKRKFLLKPGVTHKDLVLGRLENWYDASKLELQEPGTYGNLGRHVIEGPGFANLDFSLFKGFPLTETWRLQFRAKFFNIQFPADPIWAIALLLTDVALAIKI